MNPPIRLPADRVLEAVQQFSRRHQAPLSAGNLAFVMGVRRATLEPAILELINQGKLLRSPCESLSLPPEPSRAPLAS